MHNFQEGTDDLDLAVVILKSFLIFWVWSY